MSVLMVTPSFAGGVYGGVQVTARMAWEALNICPDSMHPVLLSYENGSGKSVGGIVEFMRAAMRVRGAADTILFWHMGMLKALPFVTAGKPRLCLYLHGIEAWRSAGTYTGRLLRKVDAFLTNSDYTWERFVTANPDFSNCRHRTVHLGIDSPLPSSENNHPDENAVLMLGRMDRGESYKGHREVIECWPLVIESVPGAQLWIAGCGDLMPDLETLVRHLGLEQHVHFFGAISEECKQDLLRRCRCLALPSRAEGFGLVYLEAMRLGRPCLVSTLDAGREVVNPPEAGLAVDPGDASALAAALRQLLSPGQSWCDWSLRARRRYENHFTGTNFQDRLIESLASL